MPKPPHFPLPDASSDDGPYRQRGPEPDPESTRPSPPRLGPGDVEWVRPPLPHPRSPGPLSPGRSAQATDAARDLLVPPVDPGVARVLLAAARSREARSATSRSPWFARLAMLPIAAAGYVLERIFGTVGELLVVAALVGLVVIEVRRVWRATSPDL